MELKEMTVEQLQARMGEIPAEVDSATTTEDVEARTAELKAIKDELEARKNLETAKAEARKAVADGAGKTLEIKEKEKMEERKVITVDSEEYRSAFLKALQGKELSAEERSFMNELRTGMDSGTSSGGYAIPTVTRNMIIENLIKLAPMLNEIDIMHIPSNVSIAVESSVADAAIHTENASISASEDTLVHITLSGYEIVKTIDVSAKLSAMAIPAFEAWLASNLSRKTAEVVENYIINGTGSSQPKGIEKAETWVSGTNGVDWASTAPTVAEIEQLIGLQNPAYVKNAKFLMNWKTLWNKIHVLRDDKFEPVLVRENGVYMLFGFPVVVSSKVADDTMYFGDFYEGVKANFAQDVEIAASREAGFASNKTIYRGACLFDCTTVSGRIVKSAASF